MIMKYTNPSAGMGRQCAWQGRGVWELIKYCINFVVLHKKSLIVV